MILNILIKSCGSDDIGFCAEIFASVYSEPPYNEMWEISDAVAYLERFWNIDPSGCFVARLGEEVVGAIFSFSYPWRRGKSVCIQELFVSFEQRRKGIARRLLQNINQGQKVGAWLVSHVESDASKFYEKMGFSLEGPYKFRHGVINT